VYSTCLHCDTDLGVNESIEAFPMRPEFAAWRYGDQFGRRRSKAIMMGVGGVAGAGGVLAGGIAPVRRWPQSFRCFKR
jgi:hypothetical protein